MNAVKLPSGVRAVKSLDAAPAPPFILRLLQQTATATRDRRRRAPQRRRNVPLPLGVDRRFLRRAHRARPAAGSPAPGLPHDDVLGDRGLAGRRPFGGADLEAGPRREVPPCRLPAVDRLLDRPAPPLGLHPSLTAAGGRTAARDGRPPSVPPRSAAPAIG